MSAFEVGDRVKTLTGPGHILNELRGTVVKKNYSSDSGEWVRVDLDDDPRANRVPFRPGELRRLRGKQHERNQP